MLYGDRLTTTGIRKAFAEEIASLGGTVAETFDDGERLFIRSVLPAVREVRRDDRVRHGVALRATADEVWIHPYVFRQVCSNGAIVVQAVQSSRIDDISILAPDRAESAIREAVRACAGEETFAAVVNGMRSASEGEVDVVLAMMPFLARLSDRGDAARLLSQIVARFRGDADPSRFGLMNAVTSVARDTSDPETRWRLEEFGGEILAGGPPASAPEGIRSKPRTRAVSMTA